MLDLISLPTYDPYIDFVLFDLLESKRHVSHVQFLVPFSKGELFAFKSQWSHFNSLAYSKVQFQWLKTLKKIYM